MSVVVSLAWTKTMMRTLGELLFLADLPMFYVAEHIGLLEKLGYVDWYEVPNEFSNLFGNYFGLIALMLTFGALQWFLLAYGIASLRERKKRRNAPATSL